MKTSKRFDDAVSKLVNAYFNGTLGKGQCNMCAVGNMCNGKSDWSFVFCTDIRTSLQEINPSKYLNKAKEVIDATGYSWKELAKVENTFESNTKIEQLDYYEFSQEDIDQDQFNGLMAVIDVLCEIEGYNIDILKETKEMFIKM